MATNSDAAFIRLRLGGCPIAIQLAVFDCDGVLLDTMSAKVAAFRQWVCDRWPEHETQFMDHVMENFGRSRVSHLSWFFNQCIGLTVADETLCGEVERFAEICEPLCADAGWLPGSSEFVAACEMAHVPCYVLSGTPQYHLEQMLAAHGANKRFRAIIGSPPAKPESLAAILRKEGVSPQAVLFIGDAEADAQAAESLGVHFVYKPSIAKRPQTLLINEAPDLRQLLL